MFYLGNEVWYYYRFGRWDNNYIVYVMELSSNPMYNLGNELWKYCIY